MKCSNRANNNCPGKENIKLGSNICSLTEMVVGCSFCSFLLSPLT